MAIPHEVLADQVAEHRPLSAHRLRDQERPGRGMVETGGVELDHLHVGQRASRPGRHGNPVRRGDVRVRRVEIYLTAAAGGQHGTVRADQSHRAGLLVQERRPVTAPAAALGVRRYPEVEREVVLQHRDVRMRRHRGEQRGLDLVASAVSGVHDAAFAVSPFHAQVEAVRTVVGEGRSELHEVADQAGTLADHRLHHVRSTEFRTGLERVGRMKIEGIRRIENRGQPALRVVRGGIAPKFLRQDEDRAMAGRVQGVGQTGDTASEHERGAAVCDQVLRHAVCAPRERSSPRLPVGGTADPPRSLPTTRRRQRGNRTPVSGWRAEG